MNPDYGIVLLNYNCEKEIINTLNSLQKLGPKFLIIVVDNNSSDGSVGSIESKYSHIKIIKNKENLGYSCGNNIGIHFLIKMGVKRVMLLNCDVTISAEQVEKLFRNKFNVVGPVLSFISKNKTYYDLGGQINFKTGRVTHINSTKIDNPRINKLDFISGTVIVIDSEIFGKIGFLDEGYFLYFEDADFCLKVKRVGYKLGIDYSIVIFHKLSSVIGRYSKLGLYHNLRSNLLFIKNNIKWYFKPVAFLYWCILLGKVTINYFIK